MSTLAGATNIWFLKPGWRNVDDLPCEGGTGHAFSWISEPNKATLVAGG